MWQSQIEIKYFEYITKFQFTEFERITELSVKLKLQLRVGLIHAWISRMSTKCALTPPLVEAWHYSTSNSVTRSKYATE